MTAKEVLSMYPDLVKINEVNTWFSTLEEYENKDTYVQIIDDEVVVLKHKGEYIINNL